MTLTEADAKLAQVMQQALLEHADFIQSKGGTADEIKASVDAYAEVLLEWHKKTMSEIMRIASEPMAPTHTVQ
ncbi:hypothetical protein [Mesorhizobium sp.]|uniref:hypothetical protein n=1 Tax=Mesorhizobium sp. TaxID=1871066 RepID=UPI000FE6624C|nr:hypothetical protein [Mesorhizobium sp.]RWO51029.1 MAG: hypothetical protein EOS13_21725 [Mesorhizobium sp.]